MKKKLKAISKRKLLTTEKLARALEDLNDPEIEDIIKKARKGYYDDYKSWIPFPIKQLTIDLEEAGYPDMAKLAKNGKWDATKEEAEEWFEKEGKDYSDTMPEEDKELFKRIIQGLSNLEEEK